MVCKNKLTTLKNSNIMTSLDLNINDFLHGFDDGLVDFNDLLS